MSIIFANNINLQCKIDRLTLKVLLDFDNKNYCQEICFKQISLSHFYIHQYDPQRYTYWFCQSLAIERPYQCKSRKYRNLQAAHMTPLKELGIFFISHGLLRINSYMFFICWDKENFIVSGINLYNFYLKTMYS